MRKTLTAEAIPIKLWLDDVEESTLQQARNLANLPFAFSHIALMPDAHFGFGMPIGGVLATEDVIIPNAVGVDIGCGVSAVKSSLSSIGQNQLKEVMKAIRDTVPLGFKHHQKPVPEKMMPHPERSLFMVGQEYENARTQMGTLGGGNHFIEFQQGSDGSIWFMVHSGSRNLGFKVANHYNKLAISLNRKTKSTIPHSWQLAYLPLNSSEGDSYLREMNYCVSFAKYNRLLMLEQIKAALLETTGQDISFKNPINIGHNYATIETHYGKKVLVHRKGATRALPGEIGIIPGSQGTNSYIISGKGNPESFCSCSHGAGRKLGRKQARKQLDLEKEKAALDRRNILHAIRGRRDLEEAAGAYKDIEKVIELQEDLVDVLDILKPLAVIKG